MAPVSRTFPSSSCIDSSRKLYRDEAMELFTDASIRKTSCTELEASIEPVVHKISVEEVEASVELAQRKRKDKPMETPGLQMPEQTTESVMDSGFRRKSKERTEDLLGSQHEANTGPGRMGQPDLTVTSPWKQQQQPCDLMYAGPLFQLVYGILEKSCPSMAPGLGQLSVSTPNLPQSILAGDLAAPPAPEPPAPRPVPPPRAIHSALTTHVPEGEERSRDRDNGKKSSMLMNLFKMKMESASERLESGLQKL
ncbi:hypothetical protein NHX12_018197 [Muraenolepis orangiensis]|uniref:Uncharacterized protein n=1 Tax=Muraenolepis orangiensis TaxID=630683 RepID=A0A9Q0EZB3_9TELE|nr:hypothetical protein NHX12_018197 [Muraenolepis orangiensis]